MKERITDQLHIHPTRLNQLSFVTSVLKSLPMPLDDSSKNNSKS